jgi:hypothetical protein
VFACSVLNRRKRVVDPALLSDCVTSRAKLPHLKYLSSPQLADFRFFFFHQLRKPALQKTINQQPTSKQNHFLTTKMTIPQVDGLNVEVLAEGQGAETKAGESCPLPRL